jgi:hypothetical protein
MLVALVGAELEENLAVRCLWGALEAAGHEVLPIVFNAQTELATAARRLASSGAPLAGLSMVFTYRAREFARLAECARALGFRGHLVAGGHFAAFHAEQLLRDAPAIDSVGCGEGESIVCELAARLQDLGAVRGLVWRDGERLVRNAPSVKPPDLDTLAVPPRKRPFDDYLGLPITNILSSRGCAHACAFCSIAAWHALCGGDRLRLRSCARVADEMAELWRAGARIFNFHDDSFVLPHPDRALARVLELEAELGRRGVGRIAFAIKSRPDAVNEDLFRRLSSMGLFRVFLGIEAGTDESLRRLGRGQRLEDNVRALEIVNGLGLHACFNLLLLNPDSTLEDLGANVAFLRAHPRNPMNFCRTEVYTGTPLERRLRAEGRLLGDFWGWDYVIADPRAQLAYELIYPAFATRNYGARALHHCAMHVDYEHQVLSHFFGARRSLTREVKRFVVEVNLDTCAHLEAIVAAVRRGLGGERAREAFAREVAGRVEEANIRLVRRADTLVDEIDASTKSGRCAPRGWARTAASAGLVAASVALVVPSCKGKTFATEMVAPRTDAATGGPPEDVATHPCEMVAAPPEATASDASDAGAAADGTGASDVRARDAEAGAPARKPPGTHRTEMAPRPPRTSYDTEQIPMAPRKGKE